MPGKNWAKPSISLLDPVGDIVATRSALIDIPVQGAFDGTVWSDYRERVPEFGTKVSVVVAL